MKRHRHLKGGFPTEVSIQLPTARQDAARLVDAGRWILAAGLMMLAATALPSHAADVSSTWNGVTGNWSDAANWTPNTFYPNNGNGGFTFEASISAGAVTLTEDITIENLTLWGGTIAGDSGLTLNGAFNWSGGSIQAGLGAVTLQGGGTVSGGHKQLQGRTVINEAGSTWVWQLQPSWSFQTGQGTVLDNRGLIDIQTDSYYTLAYGGTSTIENGGTLRKSSPGGVTISVPLNNTGSIDVQSGTLALTAGSTEAGTVSAEVGTTLLLNGGTHDWNAGASWSGPGQLQLTSGTLNLNDAAAFSPEQLSLQGGTINWNSGPFSVNEVTLQGSTWQGDGGVTIGGMFNWSGGSIQAGAGALTLRGGGTASGGHKQFQGRTVINETGSTWIWQLQPSWSFQTGQGSVLDNRGLVDIKTDIFYQLSFGGTSTIENSGTLRKSGGTGTTTISVPLNNTGSIEVQSGTLAFNGGGAHTGEFSAAGGSTVSFAGNHNLSGGASVTAAGAVAVTGGLLEFNTSGNVTIPQFNQTSGTSDWNPGPVYLLNNVNLGGGTLNWNSVLLPLNNLVLSGGSWDGDGEVDVNGMFNWSGGSIQAGAGALTLRGGGTASGGHKQFQGRTVINETGSTWIWQLQPSWSFQTGQGSVLDNRGLVDIKTDIFYQLSFGGTSTIENSGTLRKSGGTGTTTISVPLNNTGSIEVQSGTLAFNGGFTQTDGALNLVDGNATANSLMAMTGGLLTGAGNVSATVNLGGSVVPGTATTAGQLTINGGLNMSAGAKLAISLGGSTPATGFDVLQVNGTLALNGVLDLSLFNGFTPAGGENFVVAQATTLNGAFANVASGQRLTSVDGLGSFLVHYGAGSPFSANQIVLSGFEPCEAPLITSQPAGQTVCPNTQVSFIVAATGAGLNYQWIKNGDDLPGETGSSLVINSVQTAQAGQYWVRVQNTCGVELSATASLNVVDTPPTIALVGPSSMTVEACTGSYNEPGATATDDCDGPIPVSDNSNTVNTSVPGTYVVTYTATDSSTHTAIATRTVTVQDTTLPALAGVPVDLLLQCSAPDKQTQIDNWLASVTASDTCGTATVANDFGGLAGCDSGSRLVTWTAADGNGNSATVSRTLTITADGALSGLTFTANPLQATFLPDELGQITVQAVNSGDCPILIETANLTGPDIGPSVVLASGALPLTVCPGDPLNLTLDVDTTSVVPGIGPYAFVLTLQGPNGGDVVTELQVSVVEGGLPDLTANRPGGGVTILPATSPVLPAAGEAFTIHATLFNIGTADAGAFKVRFFEGPTLLGEQTIAGLNAGANMVVDWPVPAGRPEGFYLFRIEIVAPAGGEVTLANNDTSALLQVGNFPSGTATIVVQANALPNCGVPTSVFVSGTAVYEITSLSGVVRYPVKGAPVTLAVIGGASVNAGHTLVDGSFSGYVPALTAGSYTVVASVTDTTLAGQDERTYAIPAVNCPSPGGVVLEPGTPSEKLPYVDRNLYVCNGDFFVRLPDCSTTVLPNDVPLNQALCLGVNVHYFEINGNGVPQQPVYLTAYEQLDGVVIPYPISSTAVSFVGGGSAEARFSWTPPHAGTFILQAQLNPTFPQGIEDDTATTTIIVGAPDATPTRIQVTAQGVNLCTPNYQGISGRAVYTEQPGDIRPVICGDVIVTAYSVGDIDNPIGSRQLLGIRTGNTDRFGNFALNPHIQPPPGHNVFVVEVTDGTLTGRYEIAGFCEQPNAAGEPSPDTPPNVPVDVFVYSEDIGFLATDCLSPLNRWPLPGETISIAAGIHYYGPTPGPVLPVDVSVLLPVGNQLVRQPIATVIVSDWSSGGLLCVPWTPLALGPQIVEVATRPDLVPLTQFTGNDAGTRLIFVGEVDCQLTAETGARIIEAGNTATVNLTASRVSGEGSMELSVIYAGEGNLPGSILTSLGDATIAMSESTTFSVQTTTDTPPGLYRFILIGNGDTCQALATVNVRVIQPADTTPPAITCPIVNDPLLADASCRAVVPPLTGDATASDNRTSAANIVITQNPAAGAPLGLGDRVITLTATDEAGNTATCEVTLTVIDVTPPEIVCPAPVPLIADLNCQAAIPELASTAQASDCNGPVTVAQMPAAGTVVGLGTHPVTVTATDAAGKSASCTVNVTVVDQTPPAFACPAPVQLQADNNGQAPVPDFVGQISATDCNGLVTVIQSPAAATTLGVGTYQVLITATDPANNQSQCEVEVTVTAAANTPPVVTIEQPTSGFLSPINQYIPFRGTFTDDGPAGTHTAKWTVWSATLPATTVTGTVADFSVNNQILFPEAGVYSIKLVVTDAQGASGEATKVLNDLPAYVVIYDPDGGFVTGGGWIWSPVGAFHPGLAQFEPVQGKANFGFVAKYKKGATIPTGQTEFQFKAGDLNFHSSSYQWLVVAGARAQYKGNGTINGSGNYGFMLTAIDGQINGGGGADRFRMKIWDAGAGVIYDNQAGSGDDSELDDLTILQGGSIVIHKK